MWVDKWIGERPINYNEVNWVRISFEQLLPDTGEVYTFYKIIDTGKFMIWDNVDNRYVLIAGKVE